MAKVLGSIPTAPTKPQETKGLLKGPGISLSTMVLQGLPFVAGRGPNLNAKENRRTLQHLLSWSETALHFIIHWVLFARRPRMFFPERSFPQ